ncbi:transglutaminase-like domain-containing protein [Spirochaeta cellobiosiphila]|uniref:transglutaminase-like domain-containing protein n=1 Tax=Spirochaeta cellobiosiphila TaxID=504483 RepID=UPI00048D01AA|nr:transglutaminase-like domain-containing protein [Spirochaeta cellobiosiphila]
MKKIPKISLIFIAIVIGIFLINLYITRQKPHILSVEPKSIQPGMDVQVRGNSFGRKGYLTIDGDRILKEQITEWDKNLIRFVAPDNFSTGVLIVNTDNGASRGVIVANNGEFPSLVSINENIPLLTKIGPSSAQLGSFVTLEGDDLTRFRSGKIFLSGVDNNYVIPIEWIHSWTDNSIVFTWLGDFAANGISLVQNNKSSNIINFETKINQYVQKENFKTIIYNKHFVLSHPKGIVRINAQDDFVGIGNWEIIGANKSYELRGHYVQSKTSQSNREEFSYNMMIELQRVSWHDLSSLPNILIDKNDDYFAPYLKNTEIVPAGNASITSIREYTQGRYTNPYNIAVNSYNYLLKRQAYTTDELPVDQQISTRRSNPMGYNQIYAALMRNAHIPARVISGMIMDMEGNTKNHSWVEIFLVGAGWIIVDPSQQAVDSNYSGFAPSNKVYLPFGCYDEIIEGTQINNNDWNVHLLNQYGDYFEGYNNSIESLEDTEIKLIGDFSVKVPR